MMRISSLSADTIDYILTSLTDFKSLASVLLASKSVYGVYSTRPTSIKRAVAYNVVGPALPQALRLVRCDRQEMKQLPAGELPGEDELEKNPCLSSDDIRGLVKISEQAQELEDIFSWREKDHAFRTSRLSAVESYRFQRALFRICLAASVYSLSSLLEEVMDGGPVEYLGEENLEMRQEFFDTFSTLDLKEISRVGAFLQHIATWSANAYSKSDYADIFLSNQSLLDVILGIYRGKPPSTYNVLDSDDLPDIYAGFLSSPLDHILSKRKQSSNTREAVLLTSTPGTNLECDQCQCSVSTRKFLWGPADWEYLRGYVTPDRVCMLLKGQLPRNFSETSTTFHAVWTQHRYEVLISEVFDCMTAKYGDWKRENLLCLRCLCQFLRDHLHIWYMQRNQNSGIVGIITKENCWYGYNCRTQTHNYEHSSKLNHWCEPTSGDPAPSFHLPVPSETDF